MPDYSYNKQLYRPSHYDENYKQLATPYTYQNVNITPVRKNVDIIEQEIVKSISGKNGLKWLRVINTEDHANELDGTFEKDFAVKYGELIQKYYGSGNWNLTINPEISSATIINNGYTNNYTASILYPQFGLFWNSHYNRYFAVWYSPITKNKTVLNKATAISYIKELSKTPSYILKDTQGIILKVTDELGFTPQDTLSVGTTYETNRVLQIKEDLPLWGEALNKAQLTYFDLLAASQSMELEKQYAFIDEDKSIFNTIRKTYMVFQIDGTGYYGDLHEDLKNGVPDYWDPTKDYKTGDFVLGTKGKTDTSNYNYLYCCLQGYKASEQDGKFHRSIKIKTVKGEVEVNQWYYITDDYAKEIEAIEKTGITFNPKQWVRFTFPAIENEREIEYYPNGNPKPNQQEGWILWGEEGITLREVKHHKDTGKKDKDNNPIIKEYTNYISVIESDLDRTKPLDPHLFEKDSIKYKGNNLSSPSDTNQNFFNVSKKIIRYFRKTSDAFSTYAIIDAKIEKLKNDVFHNRSDLLKVVLRSAITNIGHNAFSGCSNLQHVLLPKNLEVLGKNAFAACTSLKRATIPDGITAMYATYIGCTELQSVVLGSNCTEIGESSFANCINLKKIYNTSKLEKIGENAFNGCENLINFTVPKKVTKLLPRTFKNCKNTKIIINSETITELGESCFEGCEKITEAISFANVTQLEPKTYKDCINLTQISFNFGDKNIKKIIPESFCSGCYRLNNVDLGNAKSIEDKAFLRCAALEIVTIPQTVRHLGESVFYDCFKLGQLKVPLVLLDEKGNLTNTSWIEGVLNNTNRMNWMDGIFTTVTDYNGVEINWQMMLKIP